MAAYTQVGVAAYSQVRVAGDEALKWELGHPRQETCAACILRNIKEGGPPLAGCGRYQASASARRLCPARTTHNAIIVLQVLMKSRALSAECLLGLQSTETLHDENQKA